MRYAAEKAPAGATNQTQGVLNTRGRFGSRRRSTRIPTDTITNASSVPIETRLAASRIGRNPAKKATKKPPEMGGREGGNVALFSAILSLPERKRTPLKPSPQPLSY